MRSIISITSNLVMTVLLSRSMQSLLSFRRTRSSSIRTRSRRALKSRLSFPLIRLLFPIILLVCISTSFLTQLPQGHIDSSHPFYKHISTNLYSQSTSSRAPFGYYSNGSIYQLTPAQKTVRDATRATFRAYMNNCMGQDEFIPTTGECSLWFNIGLTPIDSIDTLLLMDLREEYHAIKTWASSSLSFEDVEDKQPVSLFELNIRAIAGLNTAYEITSDPLWLEKSIQIADQLLHYFSSTKTGCPPRTVFLGKNIQDKIFSKSLETLSSPAEAGTLQLEFRTLTRLTGQNKYSHVVDRCMNSLLQAIPETNLVPTGFDVKTGEYFGDRLCIGGNVDSFYEMMLKTWIAFGKQDNILRETFEKTTRAILNTLLRSGNGFTYVTERSIGSQNSLKYTMDHLSCYFPGMLALAAMHGMGGGLNSTSSTDYLPMARRFTESCYAMSRGNVHGLAGEITDFSAHTPESVIGQDTCFLRPEIVEALYYLDRIDPKAGNTYKNWGLQMWNSMLKVAQVEGLETGVLSSVSGLSSTNSSLLDKSGKLHSFVVAETFKYLFLLFDERNDNDAPISVKKWIYNTEAHPVPIIKV